MVLFWYCYRVSLGDLKWFKWRGNDYWELNFRYCNHNTLRSAAAWHHWKRASYCRMFLSAKKNDFIQEDSMLCWAGKGLHGCNMTHIYTWKCIDTRFMLPTTNDVKCHLSTSSQVAESSCCQPKQKRNYFFTRTENIDGGISDKNQLMKWI